MNDIVEQLRNLFRFTSVSALVADAADEIERTREERDWARKERDEAQREVCKLTAEMYGHFGDKDRLVIKRESYMARDVAKERGWKCYDEGGAA